MLWTSWDMPENENYKLISFKNFVLISLNEFENFIPKVRPDLKFAKHDWQKRDGHGGHLYHEYWENKFLQEIERRGWKID